MKKLLSRGREYNTWKSKLPKGVCTFCEWRKYQIPLKEFDNWVWVANIAPYWHWHTMLVSKRHLVEFGEINIEEMGELVKALKYVQNKYNKAHLKDKNGKSIENFVYFWRFRKQLVIDGEIKCLHFHLHFAPQIEHSWDPTLEKDAHLCDVVGKLK